MTAISAASSTGQLLSLASAGPALPQTLAKAASATPSDTMAISVAVGSPSGTPAERRVDSLMEEIKTHNDIADSVSHFDWKNYANYVGHAKADTVKAASDAYLRYSTARIGIDLAGSGISVQPDTTTKSSNGDAVPRLLSVSNFSFKTGGSIYAVSAGKDGTLVDTKDGQAWKTWQITPNHAGKVNAGAQTPLPTFQGLLSQSKPSSFSLVQINA